MLWDYFLKSIILMHNYYVTTVITQMVEENQNYYNRAKLASFEPHETI